MIELIVISLFSNFIFFKTYKGISNYFNIYDAPDNNRKIHISKISNIGGFVFFFNILIFLGFKFFSDGIVKDDLMLNIYLFSILFFFIGFFDDRKNLNSILRLFLSGAIFYLLLIFNQNLLLTNVNFSSLNLSINFGKYSSLVTILCVMLFLNALNMFDGINLQSAIYLITIFSFFIINGINEIFFLLLLISLIFFSYYNYKNKIFLGNSGIWFCSLIISCSLINSHNQNLITVEMVLMLLLFPGIDMLRVFTQRILKGKHPFNPDKNHIHHIITKSLSQTKAVIIIFFSYFLPILFFIITSKFIISLSILILIYVTIFLNFKKINGKI